MRRDDIALRCARKQGPVCGLVLVRTLRCAGGIFGDVHAAAENLRSNRFLRRELFCSVAAAAVGYEGLYVLHGFLGADLHVAVVHVDELVAVVAHAHLLHIGELPEPVA